MGIHHATQSMYSNLIPAYYIPPHVSASQKPTGGYFVSVPTILSQQPFQQPLQLVPGIYNNFGPIESQHPIEASNFGAGHEMRPGPGGQIQDNRVNLPNIPGDFFLLSAGRRPRITHIVRVVM